MDLLRLLSLAFLIAACGGTVVGNGRRPEVPTPPQNDPGKSEETDNDHSDKSTPDRNTDTPPSSSPIKEKAPSWEHPLFDYLGAACASPLAEALGGFHDAANSNHDFVVSDKITNRSLVYANRSYEFSIPDAAAKPFGIAWSFDFESPACLSFTQSDLTRTVVFSGGTTVIWKINSAQQVLQISVAMPGAAEVVFERVP